MTESLKEMLQKLSLALEIILPPCILQELLASAEIELCVFHFGLGMYLRNNILNPDSTLFTEFTNCGIIEKDDMSNIIISEFCEYLSLKQNTITLG